MWPCRESRCGTPEVPVVSNWTVSAAGLEAIFPISLGVSGANGGYVGRFDGHLGDL